MKKYLEIFRNTGALLDGHFVLTSGRHSASYFQCAKVMQYPEHLLHFTKKIMNHFINTSINTSINHDEHESMIYTRGQRFRIYIVLAVRNRSSGL